MINPTRIRIYVRIIANFKQKEWNSKEYYNSSIKVLLQYNDFLWTKIKRISYSILQYVSETFWWEKKISIKNWMTILKEKK